MGTTRLPVIENAWLAILHQLRKMSMRFQARVPQAVLDTVAEHSQTCLASIAQLILADQITPDCAIRLSPSDGEVQPVARQLRVGVFPIAADPLHWGHILCALSGISAFKLDKVIFIIAGVDPRKPWLTPEGFRHRIAQAVIATFGPLFSYSPIALGTSFDGERNVLRLLDLNPRQDIDAYYMAGTDHYRRCDPLGKPDTIQKLETGAKAMGMNGHTNHRISALFFDRWGSTARPEEAVTTFLNVHVLPAVPLAASSTGIRRALVAEGAFEPLAALPYSVYEHIQRLGLYRAIV